MPEITLSFSNEQVAALGPAVEAEALRLAVNPDLASRLEGVDVAALPLARKAKLVLYAHLIFLRQRYERDLAAIAAGQAAADAALETSPLEVV